MGSFGGYYKGDKKKPKKDKKNRNQSTIDKPIFYLPKVIEKRKKTIK